jgi:hypothetical protein
MLDLVHPSRPGGRLGGAGWNARVDETITADAAREHPRQIAARHRPVESSQCCGTRIDSGENGRGKTQGALMRGKRVQFDDETWNALDLLARDRMQDFQELADEAFTDLLRKHGRPIDLKAALRQSIKGAGGIADSMPDFVKRPVLPSVQRGPKYSVPRGTKAAGDREE